MYASLLTEPLVAVEHVAEPDLHFADLGVYDEVLDGPFVVRHRPLYAPRGFDILHADVEEACRARHEIYANVYKITPVNATRASIKKRKEIIESAPHARHIRKTRGNSVESEIAIVSLGCEILQCCPPYNSPRLHRKSKCVISAETLLTHFVPFEIHVV